MPHDTIDFGVNDTGSCWVPFCRVVLRLLYVEVPQAMATLDQWASIEGTAKHKVAHPYAIESGITLVQR